MDEPMVAENGSLVAEAIDGLTEQTENGNSVAAEQPAVEPEYVSKGLYIVRIPRPAFDDTALKKLDLQLSDTFTKLKSMNNKAQLKRGEANELRKQLQIARSLRSGSSPEFDEKMTRIRQLRDMRKEYLDKIQAVKSIRSGLECRTEEELDDKIADMERSIQHDGLSLREEKMMVQNISKIKSQRDKIREFQGQQDSLAQWEAEAKKIKAVIDEVESEINILRGERDQAKDIIDDLQKKLQAVTAVLADYDAERQDIETTKRELQEQIKGKRDEIDAGMFEYRANRKLSLQLRDLVDEGKLEEATGIAEEQVDSYLVKLNTDKVYRRDYIKLWSEQRKYLVSELLPQSGNVTVAAPAKTTAKGKAAPKPAERLVPQGAAKAQAIIAAALQEAEAEAAAKRLAEPQQAAQEEEDHHDDADDAAEQEASHEPAVRLVPGASEEWAAAPKPKAHKSMHHDYARQMAEMPEVPDYEYIMPVVAKKTEEQLSAAELKAKVREEQRQKAAEAEARKKRRQEQLAKKQASAAAARQQKALAEQQQQQQPSQLRGPAAAIHRDEIEGASGTDGEGDGVDAAHAEAAVQHGTVSHRAGGKKYLPAKAAHQLAAVKKPLKKAVKVQKWYQQYQVELAVGGCAVVMLILLLLTFSTK
eukprot:gene1871-2208_t